MQTITTGLCLDKTDHQQIKNVAQYFFSMKAIILSTILYTLMIFDFTKNADLQKWYVVNDTVMGGESAGKMGRDVEGHGLFQGHVSLQNNGGFSSIRYDAGNITLGVYSKFVIVLKGDSKAYQFRVKSKKNDYFSYTYSFLTTNDWQTIEIPFKNMVPTFRGRTLNMSNFPGEQLEEIGFLIGNKKEEDFTLAIDHISVE